MTLELWDMLKTPPASAMKPITGGRLEGKTDISPQWRIQKLTEVFGVFGFGWYYQETGREVHFIEDGQKVAIVDIELLVKDATGEWSKPIPGTGGAKLVDKEKKGLYVNDDAFKMATTDAIGTAAKLLGLAADVYLGLCDTKHTKPPAQEQQADNGGPQGEQPTCKDCGATMQLGKKGNYYCKPCYIKWAEQNKGG